MKTAIREKLYQLSLGGYQDIAADFSRTRQSLIWPPLMKIIATIPEGAKVLDLGCGTGRLLRHTGGKHFNYLGVDNSQAMLTIAKKDYPDKKFILGDVLKLDANEIISNSAPFDYIFSVAMIHHLPGVEWRLESVRQSLRVLGPEGELLIIVRNFWSKKEFRSRLIKATIRKIIGLNPYDYGDLVYPWKNSQGKVIGQRYYHVFTKKGLKKLGRQSGARIISLNKDNYNYYLTLGSKGF